MGKVRDTCGDIGDVEACKHGVEHCNCRRKRSRTSASVSSAHAIAHRKPQNVGPEDSSSMARSNPQSGRSKYSKQVHPNRSGNTQINTLELEEKDSTDRKNFNKGARGNWREKAVEKGKTKYLWTNEIKNIPSEGKKGEPTGRGPVSSNPKYGPSIYSKRSYPTRSTRSGNTKNNASVQEVKELKSILTPEKEHCPMKQTLSAKDIKTSHAKNKKELGETASASQMSRRSQTCNIPELKSISTPEKEHCQMRQTLSAKDIKTSHAKNQKELGEIASASQMSRRSQTCEIPEIDATLSPATALMSTEVVKRTNGHLQKTVSKESCADCHRPMSGKIEEFFIKSAAEEPLPTDPAPDASWMGSFILKDEEISISLQAHPTSQGLLKVKEFSKKMPQVLEFELFLYKDFSRTFFEECDPDDKDLGLYFFPNDGNRLNEYISLLENLSGDIFLRSCIDGVELLVFTSSVLHKDYRKRNKSDFLWGMYRGRRGKHSCGVEETMVAEKDIGLEDSHMELEMAGKEIVGTSGGVEETMVAEKDIGLEDSHMELEMAGKEIVGTSGGVEETMVAEKDIGLEDSHMELEMAGKEIVGTSGGVEETMVAEKDIGLEDSHMELEMVGKEIVGTVDAVVTKQSTENYMDVAPGFNPSMRGAVVTKQSTASDMDVPPGFSPSMRGAVVTKQSTESDMDVAPGFNPSMRGAVVTKQSTASDMDVPPGFSPSMRGAVVTKQSTESDMDVSDMDVAPGFSPSMRGAVVTKQSTVSDMDFPPGFRPSMRGAIDTKQSTASDMDVPPGFSPSVRRAVVTKQSIESDMDVPPGFIPSMRGAVVMKQSTESDMDVPPGFSPSMRGHWI